MMGERMSMIERVAMHMNYNSGKMTPHPWEQPISDARWRNMVKCIKRNYPELLYV